MRARSVARRRLSATAVLFAVASAVVLDVAPARAHAAYKASDPADESTVSNAPSSIWAEFTEPVTESSNLRVFDACGAQVDGGDSRPEGYRVTVSSGGATSGRYRVEFYVISALDSHETTGSFQFTVTSGEPCPGAEGGSSSGGSGGSGGGDDASTAAPGDSGSTDAGGDEGAPAGNDAAADDPTEGSVGSDGRDRRARRRARKTDTTAQDEMLTGAAAPRVRREERKVWDGIPLGGFIAAMVVAALIGAAGGRVYVAIMGR